MEVDFRRSSQGLFALLVLCAATHAGAQPITPGAVQDTLKPAPELKAPEQSPAPLAQSAEPPPTALAAATATAKTITVERFEFAGNTLFTAEQLNPLVAEYTQRPISLVQLYEAADKVTAFYTMRGYTLASAVVPAQKVNEGTVRLEVIEGRIGKLKYKGLKRYSPSTLGEYLKSPEGTIYQAGGFERNLRTVDGLPGLDVRARLQPGAEYGSSDILLLAKETLFEGALFVDNGGTENIGVIRTGGQLTVNNPLGVADQLSLTALRSRGGLLKYGSATYSLPVGVQSSRINLTYGYAEFDVAGAFSGVGGSNRNLRGEFYLPWRSTAAEQLSFTAAIVDTRADTDFSGITFNRSEVTLAEIASSYVRTHSNRSVTQMALILSTNLQSYNAASDSSNVPLKIDTDIQHLMPLPYALQLLVRGQFVYSLDPLPDTQKFSIGGPGSIRSYSPSEARGDWGYLGQVTLRKNYLLGPTQLTPRVFYDFGEVRQHQADRFPLGARPQDVSLAGYGFGADARYANFSLKVDYSIPTSNAPVSDGKEDGRFYGTLSFTF